MTDLETQIAEAQRELDEKRRVQGLETRRRAAKHAANDEARSIRREETARQLAAHQEIARATRLSKAVGCESYQPTSVYSLSAAGVVRSAMTFRNDESEYSHGSGWNVKAVGVALEVFTEKYTALGFNVEQHDKPKRVNYEKPARGSHLPEDTSLDELQIRARVVELKLAGKTYKEIAIELGWGDDQDAIKRAARTLREAMRA